MASEQHKQLSNIIKATHDKLRETSKTMGIELAWQQHLQNQSALQDYAAAMSALAAVWEENCNKQTQPKHLQASSRIKWIIEYCLAYFFNERIYLQKRQREQRLQESYQITAPQCNELPATLDVINVLDVGSCFNAFAHVQQFKVTALDLCPASEQVLRADFLQVPLSDAQQIQQQQQTLISLPKCYFHAVIFSLLLEYMPSSAQRLLCCQKAYELLQPEGILIIITPDSQHVGKNAALLKNWRYTLGQMGFMRTRFEKLPHISCLVFRKSLCAEVAQRWAQQHKEPYMQMCIEIPQDAKTYE